MSKLILASASPRRLDLLKSIKIFPDIIEPSNIDESVKKKEKPKLYLKRICFEKALSVQKKYKQEKSLERPEHWGGYTVVASKIEFWQGQSSRLHDRIEFELLNGTWKKKRLAP